MIKVNFFHIKYVIFKSRVKYYVQHKPINLKHVLQILCRHNYKAKDTRNIVFMILMQDFDNTEELSHKNS